MSCKICLNSNESSEMVPCDKCNCMYHLSCLNKNGVREEDLMDNYWICSSCKRKSIILNKTNASSSTFDNSIAKLAPIPAKLVPIKAKKNVHLYLRVSTESQNDIDNGKASISNQNEKCLEFCTSNSLIVNSTTTETASAYNFNTKKLDALVDSCEKSSCILVYSIDRFTRHLGNCERMLDILHKKDCYVFSVIENISSNDPTFLNFAKASQEFSKLLGIKIKDSTSRLRKKGAYMGRKPFGYDKIRHEGIPKLRKNLNEQKIANFVKNIFKKEKRNPYNLISEQVYLKIIVSVSKTFNCDLSKRDIYNIINDTLNRKYSTSIMSFPVEEAEEMEMEEVENNFENYYVVEKFYKVRKIGDNNDINNYQILVSWVNYPDCYWENLVSMYEDVPELVVNFLKNKPYDFLIEKLQN